MARRAIATSLHGWRLVILLALFVAACNPMRGCAESYFRLAPESRLPKWFVLSNGASRTDVTVVMTDYISLGGQRTAVFELRDSGDRTIGRVDGQMKGNQPLTLGPAPPTGQLLYPRYEVVTANGITEIIEHRRMEPIFYINDDPEVQRKLGVAP